MITIYGNKKSFYQWDLNQRLILTDVEVGTEIHFCNPISKDTECLSVFAYEDNGAIYADVPNIILQIAGRFKVYVWPFQTTQYQEITVVSRPKPADYVYTEVEIYSIERAVNEALEKAKASGEFDGKDGIDGKDGKDGHTPVKGIDYYTEAEKKELTEEIKETVTGDIDTALDNIIAIQNSLIGGDSV